MVLLSMPSSSKPTNTYLGSTTFEWRRVKIQRAAQPQQNSVPKALRWWHLPKRERTQWLTLRVKYRGGPECWYEIDARGSKGRVVGVTALHDLLEEINRS